MGEPAAVSVDDEPSIIYSVTASNHFLEETYHLGGDEFNLLNIDSISPCDSFQHKEFLLSNINQEGWYNHINIAFGYNNKNGKYMLVAAICKERNSKEFHLVGATGKNYGNTNELKVMTYQEAMNTINCEEWENTIKLEHEKMVKYNVF